MIKAFDEKSDVPLISIVISNYNGFEYLKRSLDSILGLDYPNIEVILVDNGSTDESISYIKSFLAIRLIENCVISSKNHGLNLAIESSRGEYILFLDCDVVISDKKILWNLVSNYSNLQKPGILSIALVNENENFVYFYGSYLSRLCFIRRNKSYKTTEIDKLNGLPVVGVQGASFFLKKVLFDQIGLFDELIPFGGEDVDVGIRSILLGYRNYIYSQSILLHIGMRERQDKVRYQRKFKSGNIGLFLTIMKNYSINNLIISFFEFSIYQFIKILKDVVVRQDLSLLLAYIDTYVFLFKKRKDILEKRKNIQSIRLIKRDIFLRIQPPKIT